MPAAWQTVDADGRFTFSAPADMVRQPVQGFDSYVGRYESNDLRLQLDYGRHADPLRYADKPDYQEEATEIGGKGARLISFTNQDATDDFKFVTAVHVPDAGADGMRLTMWVDAKEQSGHETAERIFRSVTFP